MLAPRRRTSTIIKRCVRERGIHALHSHGSCCRHAAKSLSRARRRAADQTIVRHPRATRTLFAFASFAACGCGTGIEPVTARLTSGALTSELTGVVDLTIAFVTVHVRNARPQPVCNVAPRAAGPATSKPCFKSHRKKCPRQESNLVFDLRKVACASGTLRRHRLHPSTPPRNRTPSCRFEVCRARPSHSQGKEFKTTAFGLFPRQLGGLSC
jgi:hypothetical protein